MRREGCKYVYLLSVLVARYRIEGRLQEDVLCPESEKHWSLSDR